MKKTIQILTFLLLSNLFLTSNSLYSQDYLFPTSNAIWVNAKRDYVGFFEWQTDWVIKYCANGNDTIINSTAYKQLDICTINSSDYYGAIRYDSSKVYFVIKDSIDEHIMYDFSLNIGDTRNFLTKGYGNGFHSNLSEVVIIEIDTILVNSTLRKQFYTSSGLSYIEGIGSQTGLFMEMSNNLSNYNFTIECMSENDTIQLYSPDAPLEIGIPGTCSMSLSVDESELQENEIKVFPNPSSGTFSISANNNQLLQIKVFNASGSIISSLKLIGQSQSEIKIDGASGLYFMEITFSNGKKTTKKVILEK